MVFDLNILGLDPIGISMFPYIEFQFSFQLKEFEYNSLPFAISNANDVNDLTRRFIECKILV